MNRVLYTYILDHVAVLVEPILCSSVIFQIDTKLKVLFHDKLKELGPLLSFGTNDIMELFQSKLLLSIPVSSSTAN
jgi:hypothetical protein